MRIRRLIVLVSLLLSAALWGCQGEKLPTYEEKKPTPGAPKLDFSKLHRQRKPT